MEFIENGLIYETQEDNGKEVARYAKYAFIKVVLDCPDQATINQAFDVTMAYYDYQGNPLPAQATDFSVGVYYDSSLVGTETVTPVEGKGTLSLEFAGAGEYTIRVVGNCTCDPAEKKVIVNG